LKIVSKCLFLASFLPIAVVAQPVNILSISDRCQKSYALTCYGYEDRFCIAVYYLRGDAEFAGKIVQEILDNVSKQAQARRPSRIEITSHYMARSELESKKLAMLRAKNVRLALIERGVSSKIIEVKSPVQRCVVPDDQIKQRRVEVVFVPEK
jgi:hypothetical protein